MRRTIDIQSKGEITEFLLELAKRGQIKECLNLRLDRYQSGNHAPICEKHYASSVPASNVDTDITGYGALSSYSWPKCPATCPYFKKSDNFMLTVSRDQYDDLMEEAREANKPEVVPVPIPKIKAPLPYPEKVTLEWLFHHVPARMWIAAIGLLLTAVLGGIQLTRLKDVREWFGLNPPGSAAPAPTTSSQSGTAVPAITTKK